MEDNDLYPFANGGALEARVHPEATKVEVAAYENALTRHVDRQIGRNQVGACQLFIRKFITHAVNCKDIFRLTGFIFNFPANILNVSIDGTFVRFESHTVNGI
jgi:hypothetical protein